MSSHDLRVDLAALTFADSSLMLDLAVVAQGLRRGGRTMRLRGAQPQVARVIATVGLDRQPGVIVEQPFPAVA
jgi:anti-anti-sigma regulatory factor